MKRIFFVLLCVSIGLLSVGCQNAKSRAPEGAVIGGVLGAAAGGIIGHQSHHGGEGAAIGAAAGALTGALIGSQIAKPGQQQAQTQGTAPAATQQPSPNQMSMQQIIDLSKQGVNEAVIIDKIRLTNSRFNLTADDINNLKQQGVSQKVIDAMQGR
jgi:outer membrane lipoprotein SlyB